MKSIKKFISELSTENKISIIGHILTLISLLLVFLTLLEMQIQRNRTYMPQIVAESQGEIIMNWKSKADFFYLNDKEVESYAYDDITLDVYNIGTGTAKNIEFEWDDSNIENLTKNINNNSNNFTINFHDDKRLVIKSTDIEMGLGEIDLMETTKLNFLASQNDKSYKVKVPRAYLVCIKAMLIDQKQDVLPSLKLNAYYEDIQGKKYEQKFLVNIEFNQLISSSGNDNDEYKGTSKMRLLIH